MLAGRGPARLLRALGAAKVKVLVGHVYCRDAVVPIVEGDTEYRYGLHAIPQQPTIDGDWVIFDASPDNKTGWRRIRFVRE